MALYLGEEILNFIRMVDNDRKIFVLNESFKVGKEFISGYVFATICLKKQTLEVFYRAKDQDTAVLIEKFEYKLSDEVNDLRHDIGKTS